MSELTLAWKIEWYGLGYRPTGTYLMGTSFISAEGVAGCRIFDSTGKERARFATADLMAQHFAWVMEENDRLRERIAELEAENAKLKSELHAAPRGEVMEIEEAISIARNKWAVYGSVSRALVVRADEIERLNKRLQAIKREWQAGIGEIDTPWRRRMAELIGDTEG